MVSGEGNSVTVGCAPSDRWEGQTPPVLVLPYLLYLCQAGYCCGGCGSLEVVTFPISAVSLTAGAENMSYQLPLSHSTSHLPLLSSDLIPALKQQHKKRLKSLKIHLFDSG